MTLLFAVAAVIAWEHFWRQKWALDSRRGRWRLFELRDRLRLIAIDDERVAKSEAFHLVDRQLSGLASSASWMSIWFLLIVILRSRHLRGVGAAIHGALKRLGDQRVSEIHAAGEREILLLLRSRHPFLTGAAKVLLAAVPSRKRTIEHSVIQSAEFVAEHHELQQSLAA